jgi:hypothetical protein
MEYNQSKFEMNNHNVAGFDNQNQGADAGALLANG